MHLPQGIFAKPKHKPGELCYTGPLNSIGTEPVLLMDCNALIGEGVNWDGPTQTLNWVDIQGCMLYQLQWASRKVRESTA